MEAKELTKLAVKALEDKKVKIFASLIFMEVSVLADYFCHRRRKQRQPGKSNGR